MTTIYGNNIFQKLDFTGATGTPPGVGFTAPVIGATSGATSAPFGCLVNPVNGAATGTVYLLTTVGYYLAAEVIDMSGSAYTWAAVNTATQVPYIPLYNVSPVPEVGDVLVGDDSGATVTVAAIFGPLTEFDGEIIYAIEFSCLNGSFDVNGEDVSIQEGPIPIDPTCPGLTTLLSIRTQCKQQSDNVGQSFISDAEWDGYIQSSYQELYGLIVQHFGNDYFVQTPATGYTFVTDGVNQHFNLPCDVFKLLGVDLQISSPNYWVALKPFAFADRNRMSISNNPTPSAGQTIRLLYVPRLRLPTLDADVMDGVNGWENYIVIDACMKALAKEESDYSSFAIRKQAMIDRLNSEIENRDAGSPATIVDVMGRRAKAMQYRLNGSQIWLIGNGMPGYFPFGDWGGDMDTYW